MMKNNEQGRTMLEILMVLSIIGILAISVIMMVNSVLDKFKLSRVGEQVVELSKNLTARFMAEGRYDNMNLSNLIAERVIPKNMAINDTTLTHAFGGRARIKGEISSFTITFQNIPYKACIELGLLNWTVNDSISLLSVEINTDTYNWGDNKASSTAKLLPVNLDTAAASCEKDSDNTISWTFE